MSLNFVPENDDLYQFQCNQHVLVEREFIKYVRGFEDNQLEKKYEPPELREWYPFVNSYYEFAEDYDAVNRVPHLLHERYSKVSNVVSEETEASTTTSSSAPLPPQTQAPKIDHFVERKAQIAYLETKPNCFLILGKPDLGEDRLGRYLADYWKCVYIHPETLIQEEVQSGSRAGLCIEFNLRCGRSISIDVILRLLEKRLNSDIVRHRGFVICGFPLIQNDLFSEDPMSSESAIFNVHEIFEELVESIVGNVEPKHGSRTSLVDPEEEEMDTVIIPIKEVSRKVNRPSLDVGVTNDPVCFKSRFSINDSNQMETIFSLCGEHDYILIYLKCHNEEVVNIRKDNRYDGETLQQLSMQPERHDSIFYTLYDMYASPDELYPHEDDETLKQKVLKVQRDFPGHVRMQLQRYLMESQLIIEKYILLKNPEQIIKLDARMPPHHLFQALRMRLRVLPLTPVVLPKMLIAPAVEFDEPGEGSTPPKQSLMNIDEDSMADAYEVLAMRKALGPLYKWNLSEWHFQCPVAMKQGLSVQGVAKYAVHFMNKVFFLSDAKRCELFLRNPRPYLLPPMPISVRKICVSGPRNCGKSIISKCIQQVIGGELIDFYTAMRNYSRNKISDILDRVMLNAQKTAIAQMMEARRQEYFRKESERLSKVKAYIDCIRKTLNELYNSLLTLQSFSGTELSPLPSPALRSKTTQLQEAKNLQMKLAEFQELFEIETPEDCLKYLQDESLIMARLPQDLQEPKVFTYEVVGPNSPFVVKFVSKAVADAEAELLLDPVSPSIIADCINGILAEYNDMVAENILTGWILDGFPVSVEVMQAMDESNLPDLTYVLTDTGETCESLTRLIYSTKVNETDLMNILHEIGILDVPPPKKEQYEFETLESHRTSEVPENLEEYVKITFPEFENACKERGVTVHPIDTSGLQMQEILTNVINDIRSFNSQIAYMVSPEEKVNEPLNYGEPEEIGEGFDEEHEEGSPGEYFKSFKENRRLGSTAEYDPVAYFDHNTLWKGKEEFLVRYMNKMWLFANEDTMHKFIDAPHSYSTRRPNPARDLSPRFCVVGNKEIGKTTQAQLLCKRLGLFYFNFEKELIAKYGDEGLESYLEEEVDDEVLEEFLPAFWKDPNKKAIGFVLDGFPRRPADVKFMISHYLIPDCIIQLNMDNYELNARLLEILLDEWRVQIDKEKELEQKRYKEEYAKWQKRVKVRKLELLNALRQERYTFKTWNAEESENESLMSVLSYQEAEDEKRVDEILKFEIPEPELYVNWETLENASERLQQAIEENSNTEPEYLEQIKEICVAENINWNIVNANLEITKVYNLIMQHVMQYVFRNKSLFERAYDVSVEMAEKLLENGYYFLSRFGKTCPVQMYENYNPLQMYLNKEAAFQIFPMINTNYIYFISGSESRDKFKKDVLKYIDQDYKSLPLFRVRLAVIGPPLCGKTTVSERMATEYMLEHISIGKAVRRVISYMPSSILAGRVNALLRKGKELTNDLTMQCVEAMTYGAKAVALGYIMDGLPSSIDDIKYLAQMNLVPHLIIDLEAALNYIFDAMDIFDPVYKPLYSRKFIKHRYDDWLIDKDIFRSWVDSEYQNLANVSVMPSRWKTWHSANELVLAVINEIKHYYRYCGRDLPLRVANLLVSPYEFLCHQCVFKNFCPLCLYYENTLSFGGSPPDRTTLLIYHGKFYWLCSEHCNEFQDNPEKFIGCNIRHSLPSQLPEISSLTEMPSNVFNNGYCPVCLESHKPEVVLNLGELAFSVTYSGVTYLFDTRECLKEFYKHPQIYCNTSVAESSSTFPSMDIQSMPTLGMLEQYVADQVIKALIEVEGLRVIIPGLTLQQSALVCLGLFLKINNPNTPDKYVEFYKRSKQRIVEFQSTIKEQVAEAKKTINPYLHYEEPLPPHQMDFSILHKEPSDSTFIREIVDSMLDKVDYDHQVETAYLLFGGGG